MKAIKKVVVTGANGQLGKCIQEEIKNSDLKLEFIFMDSSQLNITNEDDVRKHFEYHNYDYCINCAAYTQVDKAESEGEKAFLVNEKGPENLARACELTNTVLLQISTDFVFDGAKTNPYSELSEPSPLGIYGLSKYKGEKKIIENLQTYFIIRTSWLYSEYGNNFMKSMIKHGKSKGALSVVYDQVGTPTYARDLANFLVQLILKDSKAYGIYHYSNEGVASWYDFAKAIFEINKIEVDLKPIRTKEYPLPAARPAYSVMDKEKIKNTFHIKIPYWRDSLIKASQALNSLEAETIKSN